MTEKLTPKNKLINIIYTFEYCVKFSFWVSVFFIIPKSFQSEKNTDLFAWCLSSQKYLYVNEWVGA